MAKVTYEGPAAPDDPVFKRGYTINLVGGKPPAKKPAEKPVEKKGE
jgi:hypothetical protein